MTDKSANKRGWIKKALIAILFIVLLGGGAYWYIMNETFDDTASSESAYTVTAQELINVYQTNYSVANATYRDRSGSSGYYSKYKVYGSCYGFVLNF